MRKYTQSMPTDQRLARHLKDVGYRIFLNVDRHQQRVGARGQNNLPLTHADKQVWDAQEADRRAAEKALVDTALQAHDAVLAALQSPDHADRAQLVADDAMRLLVDRGFLDADDLRVFRDAQPRYVNAWRMEVLPHFPLDINKWPLCRAAIGQAFIDDGMVQREGVQEGVVITPQLVQSWRYA
jgi:hypothetical protein